MQKAKVDQAIRLAVEALYRIEPSYTFRDTHILRNQGRSRVYQEIVHEMGNHAVASWAMLAAGEPYRSPRLYRRINWVLSSDQATTYDRSMRAQMLAQLPRRFWAQWIRRDYLWLGSAVTDQGNFGASWIGPKVSGFGDHANGQYGVLGLWACDRGGYPTSRKVWEVIDHHWRTSQAKTPDDQGAGWAVGPLGEESDQATDFYSRVSAPMTAGGVATLALTERYLRGPKLVKPGTKVSLELRKGLRWLDENFNLDDPAEASDWYYYMWTIQRVGHASGYRMFNDIDWHARVTRRVLDRQESDGTWTGPKGKLLSSGFAVLYLSQANASLAISKVRFDGAWNNRPHDLWNFADYLSNAIERASIWQIVDLDLPARTLIESPLLYLATHERFSFTEDQVSNLRSYLDAGGMLLTNPDQADTRFVSSQRQLIKALFGEDRPLESIGKEHAFYDLYKPVLSRAPMRMVHNGIRPLIVQFDTDIGGDLQTGDTRSETFALLANIYLFATSKDTSRGRLENEHVVQRNMTPKLKLSAARLQHGGTYDPEPAALGQLKAILANDHDIDLEILTLPPGKLTDQKVAFMTFLGDGELSDEQAAAIGTWIDGGGTLWLDAAGGLKDAVDSMYVAARKIAKVPKKRMPVPLDIEHPIISGRGLPGGYNNKRVQYRLYVLQRIGGATWPRLLAFERNGRPAIIVSTDDLTCGLAGLRHWGIWGYTPTSARKLVVNGMLTALHSENPTGED